MAKKKKAKKISIPRPALSREEMIYLSSLFNDRIKIIALRTNPPPPPPPVWKMVLVLGRNDAERNRALEALYGADFG